MTHTAAARLWALVVVGLGALQAFHWLRYGLLPGPWGAGVVRAAWLGFAMGAGLLAGLLPAWAPRMLLLLSAVTLLPLSLWPLAVALFAALPMALAGWRWPAARRVVGLLCVVAAGPALMLSANERVYGPWTTEAVAAVMQTRPREAADYLRQLWSPSLVLAWATYAVAVSWLVWRPGETAQPTRRGWALAAALSPVLVLLLLPGVSERVQVVRQAFRQAPLDPSLWGAAPPGPKVAADRQDLDVVLLLGEASARAYWSLYGFPAVTNPRLAARPAGELLVYRDVVSAYSHTVPSLQAMFYRDTPARPPAQSSQMVSLVDVMQQAGVAVHWYSAQETMGPWALPVTRLAERAHRHGFFNQQSGFGFRSVSAGPHPDAQAQAALAAAQVEDAAGPRLFVQHLFASHSPYCGHRPAQGEAAVYPLGEAYFGDGPDFSADLACYLDAVRWVDELVDATMTRAANRLRPTLVLFVPDHGEAPDLGTGHNSQRHSARHVEVPMLAYANPAARARWPELWQRLSDQRGQPWLVQGTFELLLDLFGLPGEGLTLQGRSPASAEGVAMTRLLFPDDRRWDYDRREPSRRMDLLSDTRLNLKAVREETGFQAPVYAHRVDTLGKALAARDLFSGIEMDVVFEPADGSLAVYHPPRAPVGLSLSRQLSALQARPDLALWLDMKNPTETNQPGVLAALSDLDRDFQIKQRAVVELPLGLPEATLKAYAAQGWKVSLYLPDELASCNGQPVGDAACHARGAEWTAIARRNGLRYLSFDYLSWPAVTRFVAPRLGPDLQLLSWDLSLRSDRPDLVQQFRRLPPLAGMIIPFPTSFDR